MMRLARRPAGTAFAAQNGKSSAQPETGIKGELGVKREVVLLGQDESNKAGGAPGSQFTDPTSGVAGAGDGLLR